MPNQIMSNFINFKLQQKNNNSYSPDENGKKYLIIMACHCNSQIKYDTIKNNLLYFAFENCDKIIINSDNLEFTSSLQEVCNRHINTKYYEIPNNNYIDFGKWVYTLNNLVDYNNYDYVVLTNDSFIIHNPINHYLHLINKYNVELYGYNDSTQVRHHFQSYLFSLRKDVVKQFIDNVTNTNIIINSSLDVINNFELQMTDWFSTKKSFLNIGNYTNGQNIFFTIDKLYIPLKNNGLLPFTKLKRKLL